ncbi:MAG TPA: hypothetical protein VGR96_19195 [Acidobacteriaceae bacterium]|nr:hypothetical protein [Acidobacteriaceae bacterium]
MLAPLAMAAFIAPFGLLSQPKPEAPPVQLPPVSADALDKAKLNFPADFSAPLNLLVLSFARDQQDEADTWFKAAGEAQAVLPKVQFWMFPVSAREDVLYKWWLNSSMRSSVPRDEPLHNIVPLYVNKQQFLKSLAIPSEKQIVVLLTDKEGIVLWRGEGSATEEKKASLAGFLKSSPLAH